MGLCKCPKRKVTNLFCFEHRVNVCEHCLVANHSKCIVQSYLQWLQDSDYNPNCFLCCTLLSTRETTRLVCYDLFHWSCLNERAAQLSRNTAPASYQCPSCSGPIFPPANLAGPVAIALRKKLSTVNWARAGLGLPLIDEVTPTSQTLETSGFSNWSGFNTSSPLGLDDSHCDDEDDPSFYSSTPSPSQPIALPPAQPEKHAIIHMGSPEPLTASAPRKVYDTREGDRAREGDRDPSPQSDCDDDKYRRRPALGWLAQLLRSQAGPRKRPLTLMQRAGLLVLLGALGFLALLILMSRLGRAAADSDPNLDPLMNPHMVWAQPESHPSPPSSHLTGRRVKACGGQRGCHLIP
ncbi:zinc finger protein-like 1 [Gracilinanus agilis]|uniref:zinc finger protein-like 1 n=1 Tax=Gracilinanus agilis TaxID=191870 RepID=UPI001CFCC137|nr:zinc finger protein-like 1 [Gracilinanus agilis]